ncbi:MAG: SurA N-terminal domain-containing protein [Candidatus Omnitrophica bacterium]|nr:SurA N-terminal domain-containing protein [Candidatus Omnitrophota bacterium]
MLLKFFRKKKNMKRIIWGLAILIIPAFVIWGAGSSDKKSGKGPGYAGKIFGEKVSFDEYADMWMVSKDSAVRSFGKNIPPEFIDQMAWNRIILLKEAEREDITVKNEEVVKSLVSFPVFQQNGSFDKKLYKSILGDEARGFEEKLRDDLIISKLREKVTTGISVNDGEARKEYEKKFEKISSLYISVPFSGFEKDVTYDEPGLLKFYDDGRENFRKPDEINVKYIEIPFAAFDKDVAIKDDQVQRYFEEHVSEYKKPDSEEMPELNEEIKKGITEKLSAERKASLAEELGYEVLDDVLKKKDLDAAGASFALESKETGFFNMQEMVPSIGRSYEFTKTGFELTLGGISNILIKGGNGFYIIQLKEKKNSYVPMFSDARDTVVKAFIKNESAELAEKEADNFYLTIKNKIKEGGLFEEAAKDLGLTPERTELTARDGYIPPIGPARELVDGVLSSGDGLSKPLRINESWIIASLDEYQAIDESKFEEEKETFREEVLSEKKRESFDNWFGELKAGAGFVSYTQE